MLTQEDHIKLEQQQTGLLEIDANKFYFDKLRPFLQEFNKTYHTDRELNRTIVEVINKVDSALTDKRYRDVEDAYSSLLGGIQNRNYTISGPMRYGSDEEKKAVNSLIEKFNDFSVILKYEKEEDKEKPKLRDRLNYQPPNGGIMGYNLDDLSNRGPRENRERIPNPVVLQDKYAY
jgi:hypothetical protein